MYCMCRGTINRVYGANCVPTLKSLYERVMQDENDIKYKQASLYMCSKYIGNKY